MALIEIDGLPSYKMVIFHGELLVITRWYPFLTHYPLLLSSFQGFPPSLVGLPLSLQPTLAVPKKNGSPSMENG